VLCDGEVGSNVPGTLYLKKSCEKVEGEGHCFWPLKKLEKLGSVGKGGSQVYAHIIITGVF